MRGCDGEAVLCMRLFRGRFSRVSDLEVSRVLKLVAQRVSEWSGGRVSDGMGIEFWEGMVRRRSTSTSTRNTANKGDVGRKKQIQERLDSLGES